MSDLREQLQSSLGTAYAVERELGGGGMSRVFVAVDNALGRRVVIKVLTPELVQGLSAERFTREIKLAAALQDPHIVPVHSAGDAGGMPYYTMPYVEGESLRVRLLHGEIPYNDAIGILKDVALALEYAHARGIVHRDIKPENVLLSGRTAVVADFGIAKAVSAARTQLPGASKGTLTSIGQSLGTPAYMAPEQAAGDPVDYRADLYAWGIMAYEMLVGRHPFADKASTAQLMAAQVMEKPMPIAERKPGLPPPIAATVMQCLEKDPNARPSRATELVDALEGLVSPSAAATTEGRSSVSAAPPASVTPAGRRAPVLAIALGVVAISVATVFFVRRSPGESSPGTATNAARSSTSHRIAVIPFENRGDSVDAYFADGMTDAIRGTLTGLADLEVIASASSAQYAKSTKSPKEIAQELGVRYLLTGTVRFAKGSGIERVQVRPALVEVGDDGTAANRWEQPFDADVKDVFKVQGDIATKVASAMQVALGGAATKQLAATPTNNPEAYDAYLRGMSVWNDGANMDPTSLRRALSFFEQAAARDSTMVDAWVAISRVNTALYGNLNPLPEFKERALAAAQRAKALDPRSIPAYRAMAAYYSGIDYDFERGEAQIDSALRIAPRDVRLLSSIVPYKEEKGQLEEGLRDRETTLQLDPRSPIRWSNYAAALLRVRRFAEARNAATRAVAIAPQSLQAHEYLAMADIGAGDLAAARASITRSSKDVALAPLVAYVATYWDLGWVLDSTMVNTLLTLGPDSFDDDRPTWALVRAQQYHWRGELALSRAWADTAVRANADILRQAPGEAAPAGTQALALAYAGRKSEAIAEGVHAVDLARKRRGTQLLNAPYFTHILARVYAISGEPEKAVDTLEELLREPFFVSRAMLRIDPTFASLRGNARFQQLTAGN